VPPTPDEAQRLLDATKALTAARSAEATAVSHATEALADLAHARAETTQGLEELVEIVQRLTAGAHARR
jgi:hypothetical protein